MVSIINCSEICIEQPKNLTAPGQTWSNYKHNNTAKYLIGPVMFLSAGWGGRVLVLIPVFSKRFLWAIVF